MFRGCDFHSTSIVICSLISGVYCFVGVAFFGFGSSSIACWSGLLLVRGYFAALPR